MKHNLTSGTANESILREFLGQISSGDYKVGQGFICNPFLKMQSSRQCDILVFNYNEYPLVHSQGDISVVFPQSVSMVIEVKTVLTKKRLEEAIDNIGMAKKVEGYEDRGFSGIIFSFSSELTPNAVFEYVTKRKFDAAYQRPQAILLFDRGAIIANPEFDIPTKFKPIAESAYHMWVCKNKKDREMIVVAYLLFRFLHALANRGENIRDIINSASSIRAIIGLLKYKADLYLSPTPT